MRLLLDTCVWGGAKDYLLALGHDVIWAGDWIEDPGDDEILERAHSEQRILVTLDKDFGKMAILHGTSHSGIIRLVGIAARRQGITCAHVISSYGEELKSGAIVTAEPSRVRVRPADET